jgi:hypothetical protein
VPPKGLAADPLSGELKIANEVRNFLGSDLYSPSSLELIVSLIYLIDYGDRHSLGSKRKIVSFLRTNKLQFTEDQVHAAWAKIEAHPKWHNKALALSE